MFFIRCTRLVNKANNIVMPSFTIDLRILVKSMLLTLKLIRRNTCNLFQQKLNQKYK